MSTRRYGRVNRYSKKGRSSPDVEAFSVSRIPLPVLWLRTKVAWNRCFSDVDRNKLT